MGENMLEKTMVVDGRDHLLGRLASIVSKELLSGQKVVVVRCELMCISGSLTRNRVKYAQFRRKRMNTNPRRGPFHFKSPSRMVWRTVRGMIPHKTSRGKQTLALLSTFEGVPPPFDKKKRMVVSAALRVLRLKPGRDFTVIGDLAHSIGWEHRDLIDKLEEKRKIESHVFYEKKKSKDALKRKAIVAAERDQS